MTKHSRAWVRHILSLTLAAAIIAFLVCRMDLPKLLDALRALRPVPVILACLLCIVVLIVKGLRWYALGASPARLKLRQSIRLTILSQFVNSFIPARGGDILKALALARENGVSKATCLASAGLDKMLDVVTVFFLAAGFPFLGRLPVWVKSGTLITLLVALALSAAILVIALRSRGRDEDAGSPSRAAKILRRIARGFGTALKPSAVLIAAALSLVSYGLQVVMVVLCSRGAGIVLTIPEAACALLVLNIAVSVPLTPLNLGTLHAAFVAVLLVFGFQKEPAMTSAIALHLSFMIPLFVIAPLLGFRTLLMERSAGALRENEPEAELPVPSGPRL